MAVDGVAAARTLLDRGTCDPGLCLYYVWLAYKAHGAVASGTYGTAYAAWLGSPGKNYDRNPPAGVPVYFGPRPGSAAGDVVISLGDGRVAATDYPGWGVIGTCTLDERQAQIGRPYLGWTDNILGDPIANAAPATDGAEPFPTTSPREDEEMLMLHLAGKHLVSLDTGVFGHYADGAQAETIKNLSRAADDWQPVSFADLPEMLEKYACDANIWDIRNGDFVVLDPLKGTVASGNTWSAQGATRAAIAGIKIPAVDPQPIVDAVKAAIAATPIGVEVDELAIADAVREKFRTDPLS
jgi:hypothetical protein